MSRVELAIASRLVVITGRVVIVMVVEVMTTMWLLLLAVLLECEP